MSEIKIMRSLLFTAIVTTLFAGTAVYADDHLQAVGLQPVQVGDVTYVTGGIGDDERSAIESEKNNYNLHIMSAMKTGEFVSDTTIVIRNKQGEELLNTTSGPLFYANIPAGNYTVESTNDGQTKSQKIAIRKGGSAHVHFGW